MTTDKLLSRYPTGANFKTDEIKDVLLEEYRSLIRLAEILSKNEIHSYTIETPLGDFHFRNEEVVVQKELKVEDNTNTYEEE